MVGQGQAHIGEEAPGQHIHLLLGGQLDGMAQRFFGLAGIVAGDHLDLAPEQTALGIDLLDRQLPALLVGLGELRDRGIAVDFTDLDRCLGQGGGAQGGGQQADGHQAVHGVEGGWRKKARL